MLSSPADPSGTGYCFSYQESNSEIKITWLNAESCGARGSFRVSVLDENYDRVADVNLPYEVIPNGRYCVEDAL